MSRAVAIADASVERYADQPNIDGGEVFGEGGAEERGDFHIAWSSLRVGEVVLDGGLLDRPHPESSGG